MWVSKEVFIALARRYAKGHVWASFETNRGPLFADVGLRALLRNIMRMLLFFLVSVRALNYSVLEASPRRPVSACLLLGPSARVG